MALSSSDGSSTSEGSGSFTFRTSLIVAVVCFGNLGSGALSVVDRSGELSVNSIMSSPPLPSELDVSMIRRAGLYFFGFAGKRGDQVRLLCGPIKS
jgi:hypothetical protein